MLTAVCPSHVSDLFLRTHIQQNATRLQCHYCTPVAQAPTPIALAFDAFMAALQVGVDLHFQPGSTNGSTAELTPRAVAREILAAAGVTHSGLSEDVAAGLSGTTTWWRRDHREGSQIEQLSDGWETFKHLVKYEMRYFFASSPTGSGGMTAERLLEVVSDVGQHTEQVWPVSCPVPLYRARTALSESEAAQWVHAAELGPPPADRAAANRMSPAGISIFYGATDRATAIAEAGSHTSYRYVVTAEFTPTRPIRLIDLTNIPQPPSIFDPAGRVQYFGLRFLQQFVGDVTLPVELDGREHIDYVPTQVFTEYVRYAFPEHVEVLMFPSTQGPGNNVVVFVGPDACADAEAETETTWLAMDPATVSTSRVMTVAR
jgi:hypothetical protein